MPRPRGRVRDAANDTPRPVDFRSPSPESQGVSDTEDRLAKVTAQPAVQKPKCPSAEQSGNSTYTLPTAWGDAHGPSAKRLCSVKVLLWITQAIFVLATANCGASQVGETALIDRTVAWSTELEVGAASIRLLDDRALLFAGYEVDLAAADAREPGIVVGRVDADVGAIAWERSLSPRGGTPNLSLVGDTVFVRQGIALEALDLASGRYLWGVAYEEAPRHLGGSGNVVLVMLDAGIVNARDARSGRNLWTIDTNPWTWTELISASGRVYALAEDVGRVGVFDASYPSATPLWSASVQGGASAVWTGGEFLFGRFDGVALRRAELATGDFVGDPIDLADGWHGELRLVVTPSEGVVLRMQTVDAFVPDELEESRWTTTLPSASSFDSIDTALDGDAVILQTEHSTFFLNAADGTVFGHVAVETNAYGEPTCDRVGTTGAALIRVCGHGSSRQIEAVRLADRP